MAAIVLVGGLAWRGTGPSVGPAPSTPGGRSPTDAPRIALIDDHGALAVVDRAGRAVVLAADPEARYGFPAWSPDGSRIAAVVDRADATSVEIFAAGPELTASGPSADPSAGRGTAAPAPTTPPAPIVAFRSGTSRPFYLYWSPDGRRISFLATETDGDSLRIAPADGSAPSDDPRGIARRGAPLYYDWVTADRLLLHVGSGQSSFVGEISPTGVSQSPTINGSGAFRPAVANGDGRYLAFARGGAVGEQLVTAHRDGTNEHALAIQGSAAMVFDPTGATLATIAADRPERADLSFPIGPLRLIDAETGATRTLVDGDVVGFFWSPDGRTIAALRLQGGSGSTVAANPIVVAAFTGIGSAAALVAAPSAGPDLSTSGTAGPTPGAPPGSALHLLFVAVADGSVRSDRVIQLTAPYVGQVLPYFDQYALSHRTWASDSSAIILPLLDGAGTGHLVVLPADGSPTESLRGASGFWSP